MSRLAIFCTGILLISALSGCCSHGGACGGGYGAPYGAGYGAGGGCANGSCGAAAPGYPSAGLYGPASPATAFGTAPIQSAYNPMYPQAAMAPIDTLSTF
jgi:hypothetical protein